MYLVHIFYCFDVVVETWRWRRWHCERVTYVQCVRGPPPTPLPYPPKPRPTSLSPAPSPTPAPRPTYKPLPATTVLVPPANTRLLICNTATAVRVTLPGTYEIAVVHLTLLAYCCITLHALLNINSCGIILWLASLLGLKNRHGHWLCCRTEPDTHAWCGVIMVSYHHGTLLLNSPYVTAARAVVSGIQYLY